MSFKLSRRSKRRLKGVHPDLVRVVNTAITLTPVDFAVLEGLRSTDRQRSLFNAGASQTLNSRHLTGHAVDLGAWVDGGIRWDWPLYDRIANAMKRAANVERVPIQWGGDWTSLKDGPHFQLPRDKYPT